MNEQAGKAQKLNQNLIKELKLNYFFTERHASHDACFASSKTSSFSLFFFFLNTYFYACMIQLMYEG